MGSLGRKYLTIGFILTLIFNMVIPQIGVLHAEKTPDFTKLSEEDLKVPDHPEIEITRIGPFPPVTDHIAVYYSTPYIEDILLSISYRNDPESVKSAYEYHTNQPPWGALNFIKLAEEYTETRYWHLLEKIIVNDDGSIKHTGIFKGRRLFIYKNVFLINVEGVTLEKSDSSQFTTLLDVLEKHAISIVDINIEDEEEDDEKYYIYPSVLNQVKPEETISFSIITENGYKISEEKISEFNWGLGACKSVSDYLATNITTGKQWITIGEIDKVTGEFTGKNIGTCNVYLYHNGKAVDRVPVEVVCPEELPGDLNVILALYRNEIPWGPILDDVYTGKAPIGLSKFSPGAANNMLYSARSREEEWVERYGPFTCGGYQKQVMIFLHNRIRADGKNCHLLNGYDFIPIRGELGMHHAVVVYPSEGDWETDGIVLDPWPTQKPAWYTIDEWSARFWPAEEEAFEEDRKVYSRDGARSTGIFKCPVRICITDKNGHSIGVLDNGSNVNEIPDAYFMEVSNDEGRYEYFYDLNSAVSDSYKLKITGISDGSFNYLSLSGLDGSFRYFEEQPIKKGQTAETFIEKDCSLMPLTFSDGTVVDPQTFSLELKLEAKPSEWKQIFNISLGQSVQQTTDGGYIIAGTKFNDIYLLKTDSDGNMVWEKTFGTSETERGYSAQQTNDGGYIVVGATYRERERGIKELDVFLIKTDVNGNTIWEKTFGGLNRDEGYSVQQTIDGGYIIAGRTLSFGAGQSDAYLIKTDSDGNKFWEKTYGGSQGDCIYSVQQTIDGGYILAGTRPSFDPVDRSDLSDVYLIKTDSDGDMVWERTYGGSKMERGHSVQQTTDGGYIVVGETMSFDVGLWDIYLVKTDSEGDLVWEKTFGGPYAEEGHSVQQTSDGGYIVAGNSALDIYIIKTDSMGNLTWERNFGRESDYGYSIQQTADGGYIVLGQHERFDIYLIKFNEPSLEIRNTEIDEEEQKTLPKYYLNIESEHGIISGSGSYSEGTKVSFKVSPSTVEEGLGVRHTFKGWRSVTAEGYTGYNNPAEVNMTSDIVEVAEWSTQYLLVVDSPIEVGGDGWYDKDSVVELYVESPARARGFLIRNIFKEWRGDLDSSTYINASVYMDGPKTIYAEWTTDYTHLVIVVTFTSVILGLLCIRARRKLQK